MRDAELDDVADRETLGVQRQDSLVVEQRHRLAITDMLECNMFRRSRPTLIDVAGV